MAMASMLYMRDDGKGQKDDGKVVKKVWLVWYEQSKEKVWEKINENNG